VNGSASRASRPEDAAFAHPPQNPGENEPGERGEYEYSDGGHAYEAEPEDECKACQSNAADGRAGGVHAGNNAAAPGAVDADPGLVLALMGFNQAGRGGEDGWEGQEKATHGGSEPLRDEAGDDANRSTK